jgi:hypothetical protein
MKSPVPEWTDAKFKSFIVSALRGAFRRYPPKQQCINNAYTRTKTNDKSGRQAKHYRCAKCKGEFPRSEVQADHKKPIVDPKVGFKDFNTWIARGFVKLTGFQCLCKPCHKIKSAAERKKKV